MILHRINDGPSDLSHVACIDCCRLLISELRWVFGKKYKVFHAYVEQCYHHLHYRVLLEK